MLVRKSNKELKTDDRGVLRAMNSKSADEQTIKKAVEEKYAAIAKGDRSGCCNSVPRADGVSAAPACSINQVWEGYSAEQASVLPAGADLGLGCGDPTAYADLQPGHAVLDLGSGAGADCFLAAQRVGVEGHVIGVDMTDEMLAKARENAVRSGFHNVEFRKGEIERLPVESGSIDRIISNCVINLAPDKARVFAEAYRVLRRGGAVTVSDIVSIGEIPETVRCDLEQWAGCTAGALQKERYLALIRAAGFSRVDVLNQVIYDHGSTAEYGLASITVRAVK